MRSVFLAIGLSALASGAMYAQDTRSLVVDLGDEVAMELVHLPAGTFEQGSPVTKPHRGDDETQRTVTLTRDFFLGKYPVTWAQFARFVAETDYRTEAERGTEGGFGWDGAQFVQSKNYSWRMPGFAQTDEDPVTLVTYADAQAFLAWLSEKSARTFALPSEAQWEYACRAGTTTAYPNGDDPAALGAIAWYRRNSGNGTRSVGDRKPNPWGLGDMTGNVWEWCADWYAPYREGPVTDPIRTEPNLPDKPRRVLRGGSWARDAAFCRSATRYRNDPASRNAENGFRVMTFDPAPPAGPIGPQLPAPVERARPAAEPAPYVPPAPPSPRSLRGMSTGLIASLLAVVGAVAIAAIALLRRLVATWQERKYRPSSTVAHRGSSTRLSTRIVDDGFWIESSELPHGSMLDCRYTAAGEAHHEMLTFHTGPRGQFVFTASRPTNVSVTIAPGSLPPPRR